MKRIVAIAGLKPQKPDNEFEPEALAQGVEVELEHTEDSEIAKEIAKAHLDENDRYYEYLALMEDALKQGALASGYSIETRRGFPYVINQLVNKYERVGGPVNDRALEVIRMSTDIAEAIKQTLDNIDIEARDGLTENTYELAEKWNKEMER